MLLFALIIAAGLFVGGGDVTIPEEELEKELAVSATSDSIGKGPAKHASPRDYREVVEKNVFSVSRTRPSSRYTPTGGSADGSSGPADYTLLGVIVAGGGEQSMAVIRRGGQGGEVKAYKMGDDIDNLVLEEISYDRVVLRQGESERVLELKPRDDEKASLPTPVRTPPKSRPREGKKNANVEER